MCVLPLENNRSDSRCCDRRTQGLIILTGDGLTLQLNSRTFRAALDAPDSDLAVVILTIDDREVGLGKFVRPDEERHTSKIAARRRRRCPLGVIRRHGVSRAVPP